MAKKKKKVSFFHTGPGWMPSVVGAGQASELLGIPLWRVQRLLNSRQYNLFPTEQTGQGRGSRRLFTQQDLHRIALANWLMKDGFATQFVGSVVRQFEDWQLGLYIDSEGEEQDPMRGVAFYRGESEPRVTTYLVKERPVMGEHNSPFYCLDLDDVFAELDKRFSKLQK